ncbi:TLC domain-containing protein 4-B isoform X1 [Syngnathoides biaculeatus]|uniref:TLC domain-containing protein 4-B isoform X1 n=2 Tax=Syngnathoides biaculeatus TaxID=300417 RepID=UPI002ADE5DF1|nr:TLC domain-containing protein 4-B isoform X1 [Syngnathoides biaculeatus]
MEMRELTVVAGSFVSFQLLFSVASPLLSSAISPSYGLLPPTKHTEWNSRLVSTVHALIVGFFCLYILCFDEAVNANPVWGDPSMVKLNVAITCGYLLYDLLLLACNWSTMGDRFFVCHHLAALYAYGYVLTRGVLPYFANFRLVSELSTPFVNQRWFFEALKYPRSNRMVVVNGVAMTVVFFLVRIAVMPSYWASVFSTFGTEDFERLGLGAQIAWITSCIALDILNTVWMFKITRGCYKVIAGSKAQKDKERADASTCSDKKKHANNHTD